LEKFEYRKVRVQGRFDHSKEIVMQPRSLLTKETENGGGLLSDQGKTGAWIITPFILSDRGYAILVNRGWVSKNKIDAKKRSGGQIEGEITLSGVVRNTEHVRLFNPFYRPEGRSIFKTNVNFLIRF
jgi:surfeit locus 1 family protein